MTYSELWRRLVPQYDEREAKAVARTLLEDVFKLSLTDLYTDGLERLTDAEISLLNNLFGRLEQGEPVSREKHRSVGESSRSILPYLFRDLRRSCSAKQSFRLSMRPIVHCNRQNLCVCSTWERAAVA